MIILLTIIIVTAPHREMDPLIKLSRSVLDLLKKLEAKEAQASLSSSSRISVEDPANVHDGLHAQCSHLQIHEQQVCTFFPSDGGGLVSI